MRRTVTGHPSSVFRRDRDGGIPQQLGGARGGWWGVLVVLHALLVFLLLVLLAVVMVMLMRVALRQTT